jgi:hypothetical protein
MKFDCRRRQNELAKEKLGFKKSCTTKSIAVINEPKIKGSVKEAWPDD